MLISTEHETYLAHVEMAAMPCIIVGILTFISIINTTSEHLKSLYFSAFKFYKQLKFHAQLSSA